MLRLRELKRLRESAGLQPVAEEMPSFSLGLSDSEDEVVKTSSRQRRKGGTGCIVESDCDEAVETHVDAEGVHRSKRQRKVVVDLEGWLRSDHACQLARADRRMSIKAAAEEARPRETARRKRHERVEEYMAAEKAREQTKDEAERAARIRRKTQEQSFRSFPHEEDHIKDATEVNYRAARRAYQKLFKRRDGVQDADITPEGVRIFFKETTCNKPPTLDKYARVLQWALYHLWMLGGKQGPKPNSRAFAEVKEKLKTEKRDTARRREEEQIDKHDELTDHLSPEEWEQFQKLQLEYASLSKEELRGTGTTPVGFLQAWADNLHLYYMMLRSKTTRVMQWSDQASRIEPMVGPSTGYTHDLISDNAKHNDNGRIEVHSTLRHRVPLFDPRFARLCHLFYLWERTRKKQLKAGDKSWQREVVSPGAKGPKKGRCAATQARYIRVLQEKLSIRSKKVTHFGRKQGIKWLVKSGIPLVDVQKAAKFAQDMLNKHFNMSYADDTPLSVQLAMAGFPEEGRAGNFLDGYRIAREHAKVDKEGVKHLLDEMLPWIDKQYEKAKKSNETARFKANRDVTEEGVLHYLHVGNLLFLQDAACIQNQFPNLPIFEMKVFSSPHWVGYKKAILAAEADPDSVLPPRKDVPSRILEAVGRLSAETASVKETMHGMQSDMALLRRGTGEVGLQVVDLRHLVERSLSGGQTATAGRDGVHTGAEDGRAGSRDGSQTSADAGEAEPGAAAEPGVTTVREARLEQEARELRAQLAFFKAYYTHGSDGAAEPGSPAVGSPSTDAGGSPSTEECVPEDQEMAQRLLDELHERARVQRAAAAVRPEVQGGRFWHLPGHFRAGAQDRVAPERTQGGQAGGEPGRGQPGVQAGRESGRGHLGGVSGVRSQVGGAARGVHTGGTRPSTHRGEACADPPTTSGRGSAGHEARSGASAQRNRSQAHVRGGGGTDPDNEESEEDPGKFYREGGYPWPQVVTVGDAWKEWSFGLENHPSIMQLEEERKLFPGSNWRKGKAHSKRFFEKKEIAEYILKFQKEKQLRSADAAVELIEKRYSSARKLVIEIAKLKRIEKAAASTIGQ